MTQKLRIGVLGAGNIANQFCRDVVHAQRTQLAAVGSRDQAKAGTYAEKYAIPRAYGSYDQLIADPDLDAIYLTLPNSMHHEWGMKVLAAGKHLLNEKPFASNTAQAEEMFDLAERRGLALVEALMYRSHPLTHAIRDEIAAGEIGQVRVVRTSFSFRTWNIEQNTRFDVGLHGGALMDIGCYCIDFAQLLGGGEPTDMQCFGHVHETSVDDYAVAVMRFANDMVATLTCGMTVQADNTVSILGDEGFIAVPILWKPPVQRATYTVGHSIPPKMDQVLGRAGAAKQPRTVELDAPKPLYAMEADDFAATALDGAPPRVTRAESLGIMRTLDEFRKQVGLSF